MKIAAILSTLFVVSTEAFISPSSNTKISPSLLRAEIGGSGVVFENVAREWRCKVSLDPMQLYS